MNKQDGRRKPPNERRTTHVTFNATDELRELLDRAASAEGFSTRTEWMKQVLTKAARKVVA